VKASGPFFGFEKAAEYSGLSRRTLGRNLPEIPHVKVGKRTLFYTAGLDAFLLRYAVTPRPVRKAASVDSVVRSVIGKRGGR
jgi:hypothetical protein